jgi:general nucleoside transport system permease protein
VNVLLNPELWSSALTLAIPIAFAALGGVFSERAGVVNIALEGKMLIGAFTAVAFASLFHSAWIGLLAAMVAGALAAMLFAWATVYLRADHIIAGLAIDILAAGLTGFLFNSIYGQMGTPSDTPSLPIWNVPLLSSVPVLGPILGHHEALVYLFFVVILIANWVLFRTPVGLRWRAVGEYPRAADAAGVPVLRVKFWAVVAAGVVAGMGGADLSIGILNSFSPNMTTGRGFIALAAVIFGAWRPWGSFAAALLFGFATSLSFQLQGSAAISRSIVLMLPYVVTILALAGFVGRTTAPAADGQPYDPER